MWGDIFSKLESSNGEIYTNFGMHSMRNGPMRGEAVICNVMATSKFTYVGQFLRLPEQILKLINGELVDFIHGSFMENIKREILYRDPSLGEIGLVCIKLKLRAFLILHIVRLLTYNEEYVSQYIELDCIIGNFFRILHLAWNCTVWNILLGFIYSANYYLMSIWKILEIM